MKKDMVVDTYWMERLCSQWNAWAKKLEKDAKRMEAEAKTWRKAARQLKAQVEAYSLPEGV